MSKELTVIKQETFNKVLKRVQVMQGDGEIHLPPDYSAQNALNSAWLQLQETRDKNDKPVLEVCTKDSIANGLLDMVIMGMNPAKKQVYFIAYGSKLACQRSYFGTMALAKRVDPDIEDIIAEPVYAADAFEYEIVRGRKHIMTHKQTIESVNSKDIKATYCMVIGRDGEIKKTELMTFEEIKKAWEKSKVHPVEKDGSIKSGSTHDAFIAEMCRKTVINRTCKPIINSSDDKYLKLAAVRSEVLQAEEDSALQIEEHANQDVIDIEAEGKETAQGEQEASAPKKEEQPAKEQQKQEPKNEKGSKEEAQENGNDKRHFFRCPKKHRGATLKNCDHDECEDRPTCKPYQKALAEAMKSDKAASEEEQPVQQAAAAGPDF